MAIIAIDGVAGAGKGTLAAELAKRLGYLHVDTGALYRCATVLILNKNIDPTDEEKVVATVRASKIEAKQIDGKAHYFLDGKDLTTSNSLRTPEVNETVAKISKYPRVRVEIRKAQKNVAKNTNCVIEGRDISTVVFPNADYKFFVVADTQVRALRRQKDYEKQGLVVPFADVVKMIEERDKADMEREASPLVCPKDACVVDNGKNTVEQSITQMLDFIGK